MWSAFRGLAAVGCGGVRVFLRGCFVFFAALRGALVVLFDALLGVGVGCGVSSSRASKSTDGLGGFGRLGGAVSVTVGVSTVIETSRH